MMVENVEESHVISESSMSPKTILMKKRLDHMDKITSNMSA